MSTGWIRFRDLDALVDSDTKFHEQLIDVSGRPRLKDLWFVLDGQMGVLMRAAVERLGIGLMDAVDRHRYLLEAVESGNVGRLRLVIRAALPSGCSSSMAGLSRASLVEHVAEAAGCTHMTGHVHPHDQARRRFLLCRARNCRPERSIPDAPLVV